MAPAPTVPWDDGTSRACGIAWLLAETAPSGAFGRAARVRAVRFGPGDEAEVARAIAACLAFANAAGPETLASWRADLARIPDIGPAIRRARAGERLADSDFLEALAFAAAVSAIAASAARRAIVLDEALGAERLTFHATLSPCRTRTGGFYLIDELDPELASARGEVEVARARADLERSRIDRIVAGATGGAAVRSGEFVIMRDRLAGPLPAAIRVVREAPTYLLCETALDEGALAALAALAAAERAVSDLEDAARRRLSTAVVLDGDAVLAAIDALGELDLAIGKAGFAARYGACAPDIVPGGVLDVEEARYLPLATRPSAGAYLPLDLRLDDTNVLTGPNMGGKTTALRTAGFVAACVLLGLPVPARRARVSLFARIVWLAPGEADAQESGLSAFGAEIVAVRAMLEALASPSLVLVDEFARTTTPREGRALLVALIEALRERGAIVFAATHASGVAAAARATPLAVAGLRGTLPAPDGPLPLAAALAAIAERMDFRVVRVDASTAASSDAIALARALGLDVALADRADAIARDTEA